MPPDHLASKIQLANGEVNLSVPVKLVLNVLIDVLMKIRLAELRFLETPISIMLATRKRDILHAAVMLWVEVKSERLILVMFQANTTCTTLQPTSPYPSSTYNKLYFLLMCLRFKNCALNIIL